MREIVICEPVRTPIGRYGGALKSLSAAELGEIALRGLLDRTGLDPGAVDDVVLGHCYPSSEAPAIGRVVALNAGLPVTVTGMQVDRRCGSGLQSVLQAGMQVSTGVHELVIAGGTESMSNVPFYSTEMRWGVRGPGVTLHDGLARGRVTAGGRNYPVPGGMLETAENLRREYGIPRAEQDQLALTSHERAVAAQRSGVFAEEIIPVTVQDPPGRGGHRYRRASARRLFPRSADWPAATTGPTGPRSYRHTGKCQRAERRRCGMHRHAPATSRRDSACALSSA